MKSAQGAIEAILPQLVARPAAGCTLIAIDGHSAAGKSSFAWALAQQLPQAAIIHMDDFYRVLPEAVRDDLDAAGGYAQYYDWQRLEAQVLAPLNRGQIARYQLYDWDANALRSWATVEPTGVVLIEGCYAARPELRSYYASIILVTTSVEQRARRQQARADASPAWLARWDAAERYYFDHSPLDENAAIVVAGE